MARTKIFDYGNPMVVREAKYRQPGGIFDLINTALATNASTTTTTSSSTTTTTA